MRAARILETALYVRDVAEAIEFHRTPVGGTVVGGTGTGAQVPASA